MSFIDMGMMWFIPPDIQQRLAIVYNKLIHAESQYAEIIIT
jgi:hypothetical protein